MRTMLIAALVATMAACGGGNVGTEACPITDERGRSCSRVCSAFTPADQATAQICGGATWDACVDECVEGVAAVAWCP